MYKILLLLLISSFCFAGPVDDFMAASKKVIERGYPSWQVEVYKKYIDKPEKLTVKMAVITSYNGQEACGKIDAHNDRCTEKTAASNLIPQYRYIWTKYGLRRVLDTGAKSNDKKAKGMGANLWIDYWYPNAKNPVQGWNKTPVVILNP
mgnify:CR=1 FL=1